MIVRNPLDRLVSAYKDKINHPVERGINSFPNNIMLQIMKKYSRDDYEKWLAAKATTRYVVPFSNFVQYVIDTPYEKLNIHFRPMINLCQPCTVKYDFYGAFKQYNNDSKLLIHKLDAEERYRYNKGEHVFPTLEMIYQYFSQLPQGLKEKLFQYLYHELEFYYHLYPEERNSHKLLLDMDTNVSIPISSCSNQF